MARKNTRKTATGNAKNPPQDASLPELNDWALAQMQAGCPAKLLAKLRIRDRIRLLVQNYLGPLAPYKDAMRSGLCGVRPWNVSEHAHELYRVVDAMWLAAGDTSADYNFYTKRALLAGVLGSTTLRWLADTSDEHEETWAFLDNRIDNVMQIEKIKARLRERFA